MTAKEGRTVAQKATLHTNHGDIVLNLFGEHAPKTVANFVGLATGTKEYRDPASGAMTTGHFYDGLTFHRVIDGFMIQGGDPTGTGRGGPGYRFDDEPVMRKYLRGTLAMANAGPNTNGSQFFINTANNSFLDTKHTTFGKVIAGMDVVAAIEA